MGFRAMQFDFVVSTNVRAIRLGEARLFSCRAPPRVIPRPKLGYIDALVMFKTLCPKQHLDWPRHARWRVSAAYTAAQTRRYRIILEATA